MRKYNFDEVIRRTGTDCLKYDFAEQRGMPKEALPFWIADMDFPAAEPILDALSVRIDHGIFGYSDAGPSYFRAVADWQKKHFRWEPEEEWLVKTPGVVPALNMAVKALTAPGDAVLVNRPVYYPFLAAIEQNGRTLINSPLVLKDGHYGIDFDDLERKIAENHVKLAILCSPHNPVGRVWTKKELTAYAALCEKYHVLVVADEIHEDFTWEGHAHTTFASVNEYTRTHSVVCTAPSKTFNVAGLQCSNIFIPDPGLRESFRKELFSFGYDAPNLMGLTACEAAYREGEDWLLQVKEYLQANMAYTESFLKDRLPKLHLIRPEGTYLLWIDAREYGLTPQALEHKLLYDCGLWVDAGDIFGPEGNGFFRFNPACPRATLIEGLERLLKGFRD